jgi:hypothetical protein
MIRIAFVINFNVVDWLGGYNVVKNLILSINLNNPKNLQIFVFIKESESEKYFRDLNVNIIRTNFFSNISLARRVYSKLQILILGKSKFFEDFFLKYKINLVSHYMPLGRNSEIKSFSWITDFQHLYYPQYFTFLQRIFRTINIFYTASSSSKIILSSNASASDLKKIINFNLKKIFVHPFFFGNYNPKNIININKLRKKFKIKKNFFFLPNQYWFHKNHLLVLKSIVDLKKRYNLSINIISSGSIYAKNSKIYYQKVDDFIEEKGLRDNYKYIGIVSEKELWSLMHYSLAVINPSEFEGWNTSVMQAKALSKYNIVSNIKAHIEQKNNKTILFINNDVISLSETIFKFLNNKKKDNYKKNKRINNIDFINYGKKYINLVKSVI